MLRLARSFPLREWLSGSRESSFSVCDRPCDPLSCLLFTALWLRCSHTLVTQETSFAQDDELSCSLTSVLEVVTCLPIGPMSFAWPVSPFDRFETSCPLLPLMLPAMDYGVWFLLLLNVLDGGRALFRHNHRLYDALLGGMVVALFFLKGCITWTTRGLVGSLFSRQRRRES